MKKTKKRTATKAVHTRQEEKALLFGPRYMADPKAVHAVFSTPKATVVKVGLIQVGSIQRISLGELPAKGLVLLKRLTLDVDGVQWEIIPATRSLALPADTTLSVSILSEATRDASVLEAELKKDRDALVEAARQAIDLIDNCGHEPSRAATCTACGDAASKLLRDVLGDRW